MNIKKACFAALVAIITHYVAYWYGAQKPANVQLVEKEVIKRDIQTVVKEVVRPDGTKETVTTIIDKSKESSAKQILLSPPAKNWVVGAYYRVNEPTYALNVNYRLVGPVYLGGLLDLNKNVYLGLSLEF